MVSKYKKRFSKRERGPEEGGSYGSKIPQRGKIPKRLRRRCGGGGGVVISKTKSTKRGGDGRGGARFLF